MFGKRNSAIARTVRSKGDLVGCSDEEIAALEKQFDVKFPADYREFLSLAGRGVSGLWTGSDYTIGILPTLQGEAKEMLKEAGLELPRGSFVSIMHQGYTFAFLNASGVFSFLEGESHLDKPWNSFTECLLETASM